MVVVVSLAHIPKGTGVVGVSAVVVVAVVVETQSHIPKGAGVVVVVAVTVVVLVEPQLELVALAESVEVDEVLSLTSIVEVV